MRLTYDPTHNIAYIALREKTAQVETIRVGDDLNIDLAPDGTLYGLELLDAANQLALGPDATFTVVNGLTGATTSVRLTP